MTAEEGMQMVDGPQLHRQGMPKTLEQIVENGGEGQLYLTFDIDCVDPTFAPGTGTPEVGGFSSAQCQELLQGLTPLAHQFVAYDMVEVMPAYHPAKTTSLLAANLVYGMMFLIAWSKKNW